MNQNTYTIIGDFHTHTMVSQHAYSTTQELVEASRDRIQSYRHHEHALR